MRAEGFKYKGYLFQCSWLSSTVIVDVWYQGTWRAPHEVPALTAEDRKEIYKKAHEVLDRAGR